MQDTVRQHLEGMAGEMARRAVAIPLRAVSERMSSQGVSSAGLVITGAGGTTAKIGATPFQAVVRGAPVVIAAGTAMPVLTGINMAANMFNVVVFFVDQYGVTTARPGIAASTLSGVRFPNFNEGQACIGYLTITSASAFTGGTTALDAATTTYASPVGAFDPSIIA